MFTDDEFDNSCKIIKNYVISSKMHEFIKKSLI